MLQRQESSMSGASYLSLTEIGKSGPTGNNAGKGVRRHKPSVTNMTATVNGANLGSSTLVRQPSLYDLSKTFGKSTYFSDMNPRSMKRLLNILGVTGQFIIFFNSLHLLYQVANDLEIFTCQVKVIKQKHD